jgi:hypothetical protein
MIPGLVAAVQEGGHIMRGGAVLPQATSACRSVVCHDSRCRRDPSSVGCHPLLRTVAVRVMGPAGGGDTQREDSADHHHVRRQGRNEDRGGPCERLLWIAEDH